jgi:membrane protein
MYGIWTEDLRDLPLWKRSLYTLLRVLGVSLRGLRNNQSSLLAAGLTYSSLMALIPLLALLFAILGALGVKGDFEHWLNDWIQTQPAATGEFMTQLLVLVQKVNIGGLGAFALLILIYTIMGLLGKMELAFNRIWQARRGRNLGRRYADYAAILLLVPLLVLVATALQTAFQLGDVLSTLAQDWPLLHSLFQSGLSLLPLPLMWIATTVLLQIMPNARVRWIPALIAGCATGTLLLLAQWAFGRFQIGLSQANAIYGSLAFVPLFLLFLQVSWSLVLWGAELSHAIQYFDQLEPIVENRPLDPFRLRFLGLQMLREAHRRHESGKALSLTDFSSRLGWARIEVDRVKKLLVEAEILMPVKLRDSVVPSRPAGGTPMAELFEVLDGRYVKLNTDRAGLDTADIQALEKARQGSTQIEGKI